MKLNLPPLRTQPWSPGGHAREFYAPDLTDDELLAAICERYVAESLK